MDNNNNMNTGTGQGLLESAERINKIYDHLTYFDLYGGSVFMFIFITLFVIGVHIFGSVMMNASSIKADWPNQRCNPKVIPFAGIINKPDDQTVFEFTESNFQSCMQDTVVNMTGYLVAPINGIANSLLGVFNGLHDSLDKMRNIMANMRTSMGNITTTIMGRVLNLLAPIEKLVLAVMDTFGKIQGVMVSSLFAMLGSYYTLQSLIGAILEFITKILVMLVVVIVGLWVMPITWPAAATMSTVFVAISVPLAIIVGVMSKVLHITPNTGIPKLRCFDKNTELIMEDGSRKTIQDISVGDVLEGGAKVTAKMRVHAGGLDMYKLGNRIIVSGEHLMRYNRQWIKVSECPYAIKLRRYGEPFLYCLNTSTKEFEIDNIIFADWDDLTEEKMGIVLNTYVLLEDNIFDRINHKEKIHKYLDKGYLENAEFEMEESGERKRIKDIRVLDKLKGGHVVYGLVEIDATDLGKKGETKLWHLLTNTGIIGTDMDGNFVYDYNNIIDSIFEPLEIVV